MKLLQDRKEMEGLEELIENCLSKIKISLKRCIVWNVGKIKKWTRHKMRLTAHIREYEMDQVIRDLVYDMNVLPK